MSKTSSGRIGEEIARKSLLKAGYRILESNFRTRFGEVDLVGTKDNCLILIEVKTRWSKAFGTPEESINPRKLRTIGLVGEIFRTTRKGLPEATRIDVVAIEIDNDSSPKRIEIIENASG